eukprot:Em0007g480a
MRIQLLGIWGEGHSLQKLEQCMACRKKRLLHEEEMEEEDCMGIENGGEGVGDGEDAGQQIKLLLHHVCSAAGLKLKKEMESDIVDDLSDDLIRDVFTYLSTNKYPEASSSSRKRVIRKKALKFFISTSGELMYKQKLKGKEPTFLRYVQSPEERRLILLACHVHPTSGHMGRTRTLHRIKERVMWHGMVKDCTEMIRTCDICQRMNRKLTCGVPELHPIPVKSPWYMIGIDFIGPISPPGEDGSQYILTISDYFTKWVEAIPTPDKTATTVANCLFKIFMRMGLPRVMLSDNGSEFCNKLNDKLAEILGVKRRLTTPYHPQANGLDERYNQTLQNMLAKFVSTKQTVWSSYLDTCTFAYNTSRHESSTYTPFQLMFGRQAILPVDIDLQKESGDELHHKYQMLNDPDIVAVQHKHQVILEDAKKHILDAQKKQKQKYDSKCAKPNCFQVGELVMKKNFRRKKMKGGKLQDRFDGPHRVVKKMPHGVYELISKDGTLIRATGGHLKMYHSNMLQGSISFDDKQASSKVISDDPSTSGVKPDDTSICSDIECYDPSTPSDAKHDGLPTPSNIGCDDTLTPSDAEHDGLPTPSNIGCDDTLTPSDAEHDRLPTPSNIGCDDTLTTSDVEHDGLTTPSNTGCDDTLTTSDVERDGLTTPSDVGCDDDTHTISHAKPDDQPTTSDTEPKDLLTLKDAEPPVLLFCSCKTRCATKRCLCKLNHSFCGHYCHPAHSDVQYIFSTNNTDQHIAFIESLTLWDAPATILLAASIAMIVVIIKFARAVSCRRSEYEPITEGGDQYWKALTQLIPLAAFPMLFFLFVIPEFVYGFSAQLPTLSKGMELTAAVFISMWGMSSGTAVIAHITVVRLCTYRSRNANVKRQNGKSSTRASARRVDTYSPVKSTTHFSAPNDT